MLRAKFQWSDKERDDLAEDIRSYANLVTPTHTLSIIQIDPSDNRILECAGAAQSDFIVSGDTRHVLPVGNYEGIRIVTVGTFLELLAR